MRKVTIAKLKAGLSQYLRYAREGETIQVLDRDTPVAIIEGIRPGRSREEDRAWLKDLERRGVIRVGPMRPVSEILNKRSPGKRSKTGVLEALLEERRTGR